MGRRATSCNRNHHMCSTSSALLCSPDLYHERSLMLCCFLFLLQSAAQQGLLRILMFNNIFDLFIIPAFGWLSRLTSSFFLGWHTLQTVQRYVLTPIHIKKHCKKQINILCNQVSKNSGVITTWETIPPFSKQKWCQVCQT